LGIDLNQLRKIRLEFSNPQDQLREMLVYWLHNTIDVPPSWRDLIGALRSPAVGESRLARELEYKYCDQKEQGEEKIRHKSYRGMHLDEFTHLGFRVFSLATRFTSR